MRPPSKMPQDVLGLSSPVSGHKPGCNALHCARSGLPVARLARERRLA